MRFEKKINQINLINCLISMNITKHVYFSKIYILHFNFQIGIAMGYIDEEANTNHSTLFYAVFILSTLYSYSIILSSITSLSTCIGSKRPEIVDSAGNAILISIGKHRLFYVTKHILSSQTQRILYSRRLTFSHNE